MLKHAVEYIHIVVFFCLSIVSTDATNKKMRVGSVSFTDKSVLNINRSLLSTKTGDYLSPMFIYIGQDLKSHLYNYALFLAFGLKTTWLSKLPLVFGVKRANSSFGEEGQRDDGGSKVLGDGERERLRGLAGSCSSVVAREHHVTCCLATLSN